MKNFIKNHIRRIAFCLTVLIWTGCFVPTAYAAPAVDTSHRVGLNISYKIMENEIENATFSVFQVATLAADGTYTLTPEFEKYAVKANGLTEEELQHVANTLYGYVLADSVTPTLTRKTNEQGKAMFMSSSLYPGLYLLTCKPHQAYGEMCYVQPMLLSLPTIIHDKWVYNIDITPKYTIIPQSEEVSAMIVWRDPNENMRPEEVEIQLLNGSTLLPNEVVQSAMIGKEEAWRHTFSELALADWIVIQPEVPEGYTLTTKREGNLFIFINTRNDYQPPTPPGGDGNPWEGWEPIGTPLPTMVPASSGTLPQTGTLWWPVPILAMIGITCIAIGLIFRRREG